MIKGARTTQSLAARLRRLEVVELATVNGGGGETASTSTSGTPEAGDDTIGDATFGRSGDLAMWQQNYGAGR